MKEIGTMFKRFMVVIMLLGLCSFASTASAASKTKPSATPDMREGLWGITLIAAVPGTPRGMPVRYTYCMVKKTIVPQKVKSGCKIYDVKVEGNTVSWRGQCEAVETEGKVTYEEGTKFEGYVITRTTYVGNDRRDELKSSMRGEYLGACD